MINKISVIKRHRAQSYKSIYLRNRNKRITKESFLLESTHGNSFYGHMLEVTIGLNELGYNEKDIFIAVIDAEKWTHKFIEMGLKCTPIEYLSDTYARKLATCEYLFNDTTFLSFFNKREEQKYYNIWHGTPLKYLGKDTNQITKIGNVQRNLYSADKIILSNSYTAEKMINSFNLNGIYTGKILETFSPRNTVFYKKGKREEIREKLNLKLTDKIYVYMPTWRDTDEAREVFKDQLLADIKYLEEQIKDDEHYYIQLHPLQNDLLDEIELNKVKILSDKIPLYDFLACSDGLVTDYSSIMYDYVNMNKPIIIYDFDKKDYYLNRGCYENVDDYGFTEVPCIEEVLNSLRNQSSANYEVEKQRFCYYDSQKGVEVKQLLEYLINGKEFINKKEYSIKNDKETVAIYSGGFLDNGITVALSNMLNKIDVKKRNYILFFHQSTVKKEHEFRIRELPQGVLFYPIAGGQEGTFLEKYITRRDSMSEKRIWNLFNPMLSKTYQREYDRIFGELEINHIIHYTGFERKIANLIKFTKVSKLKKYMWVHSDTFLDKENRGNTMSLRLILEAQLAADKVVLVHEKLKNAYKNSPTKIIEKLVVVNNFLGEEVLQEKSQEHILNTLLNTNVVKGSDKLFNLIKKDYFLNENNKVTSLLMYELLWKNRKKYIPKIASEEKNFNDFYKDVVTESFSDNIHEIQSEIESLDINVAEKIGYSKTMLLEDLLNPEIKVFINIGRFSKEKSHDRLITAFSEVNKKNPNTRLVIVAPHGNLRNETILWAKESGCEENIYILGRMSNPYNLVKLCDLYVLSSLHEGLGLVVYESLAVGTNVVTVNIPETVAGLSSENAIIVENTTSGIKQGIQRFIDEGEREVSFNFKKWNDKAKSEFEMLFK